MTALYPIFRIALGLACVAVFLRLHSAYFLISALSLLIPQSLYSATYWREIWLPIEAARLIAAIWLSVTLLVRVRPLSKQEHRSIIGFGLCAGIGITLSAWLWHPENAFQAAVAVRQYLYLTMATLMIGWCVRHWVRPTPLPRLTGYWCWWLVCATVMACGGRGDCGSLRVGMKECPGRR